MCGIVGIVRFDGGPIDPSALQLATDALAHRGPDDCGTFISAKMPVGLAHRRLSILDLSHAGQQPMVGHRPDLMLTFNGEIYNYKTLRAELRSHGYTFRSETDSEVLLHAMDCWDGAAVARLNGIFAYALLDERRGTLTLVRDRFGIKPLYYYRTRTQLVFASEIKAIIASGLYKPEVLTEALPEYLTFRSVAGERTLFRNILELTPGSIATINVRTGATHTETFHHGGVTATPMRFDDAAAELRERLTTAVQVQLQSDVPVGSMNSGGLDSSIVSALAVAGGANGLRTYCASYGGAEGGAFDESTYAEMLARHLGTTHREIAMGADEFFALVAEACWLFDEPLSHPNSIPLFKVFREARRDGVKVMLSGEGADEMFAGYDFFSELALIDVLARTRTDAWAAPLTRLAGRFVQSERWRRLLHRWTDLGAGAILDIVAVEHVNGLRPEERWGPYRLQFLETFGDDLFAAGSAYVQKVYLPPLLQRTDRMSMASGVECRVPYLDNEVAALANRLPRAFKRRLFPYRIGKVLLRQVGKDLLPGAILHRPKYGFAAPVAAWLRNTDAGRAALSMLREPRSRTRPWVADMGLDDLTRRHESGAADVSRRLWTLLTLESWARCFLDAGGDHSARMIPRSGAREATLR